MRLFTYLLGALLGAGICRVSCQESSYTPPSSSSSSPDMVWIDDPVTSKTLQISRTILEMDHEFLREAAGDRHLYSPDYLKELAQQCVTKTPSFLDFFNKTLIAVWEFCFQPQRYSYSFAIYRRLWYSFTLEPFIFSFLVACVLTGLRKLLRIFFLSTKVGTRFKDEHQKRRVLTPLWNMLSYSLLFFFDCHVVLNLNINDFLYPLCIFDTIRFKIGYFDASIRPEYFWLYMVQLAYYMHSFYATIHLDVKRADWTVMIVHHVVTIFLLYFSMLARFYRIGALVLFLHDFSDILLEAGKFTVALRDHIPEHKSFYEFFANCLFAAFTASWFFLRIYWFPLKVLHSTTWGVYLTHLGREAYFFLLFNALLWTLFAMHLYWSYFIVKMLLKICTGSMPSIEDARELEVDGKSPVESNGVGIRDGASRRDKTE
uniref:Ceramide synthase 1 n=2 Tax=Schistocephalus solidus TaxID=70667 RepID=A0A0X3Q296_SCHSO